MTTAHQHDSDGLFFTIFRDRIKVMDGRHFHWLTRFWFDLGYERAVEDMQRAAEEARA